MPEFVQMTKNGPGARLAIPQLSMNQSPTVGLSSPWEPQYDKMYRPEYNQQWHRAENQSALDQLWNGWRSRALSIGTKLGAGIASIVAIPDAFKAGTISAIFDNPMYKAMQEADESLNEMFPVFRSEKHDRSGLMGKLLTSSFWTTDVFDGMAYATSAFVPGGLIGKAFQGASTLGKSTQIGAKTLKALNAAGLSSQRASLVTATAYNTITEAAAEAYQTQKELELVYSAQGKDPKEAKKLAADGAAETFWWNSAALLFPNFVQNSYFHGGWNSRVNAVKEHV